MSLVVVESSKRRIHPGDFGASVSGNQLQVPSTLYSVLSEFDLRTGDAFLSFVQAFPSSIATALRWSLREVKRASRDLERELTRAIPGVDWGISSHPRRTFGARRPESD